MPQEVKEERWHRLMALQRDISEARQRERIGRVLEVVVDEVDEEGATARTIWDAPEIDGVVHLDGVTDVAVGERVRVKVTDSEDYDLIAERA